MVLTNVNDVVLRGTDIALASPRCTAVRLMANAAEGRLAASQSFTAMSTVENGTNAGLARIDLRVGSETKTQWVWLGANERREIPFTGLMARSAGELEISCGNVTERVRFEQ
jgi:hypothetical protein